MKILLCGIGNRIMGDDGFAQHVLEFMEHNNTTFKNVDILDFSTSSLTMAKFLEDYDAVIFLDAIRKGNKPGTVYELEIKRDEVPTHTEYIKNIFSFSFHESGLEELLVFAKVINTLPDRIFLIGCEPGDVRPGTELSDKLKPKVKEITDRICEIIEDLEKQQPSKPQEIEDRRQQQNAHVMGS